MPGLTLVFNPFTALKSRTSSFKEAQTTMLYGPHYQTHVHLSRDGAILGHVAYPEYPVQVFSTHSADIYVEGRIYNVDDSTLRAHLDALAERIFKPGSCEEFVRTWMMDHDGEYIVVIFDRARQQIAVITDPLGRLPLFYSNQDSRSLVLARECKFITHFLGDAAFDRIACGQFLCTGYPLGTRTLFRAVNLAPPGMFLHSFIQGAALSTSIKDVIGFNLEDKDTGSKTEDQHASDLVDLILSTTRDRAHYPGASTNIMSLSGGWDSRVVAAALARTSKTSVAVTYVNAEGRGTTDAKYAVQIASAIGMPCESWKIPEVQPIDEERLVLMTDGLNYVSMAYNIQFMEKLVARWGRRAVYFTGDGGPQVVSLKGLRRRVNTMDQLVDEITEERSLLPVSDAETIMRLAPGTLKNELFQLISSYPEHDLNQRGARFAIYERGRRWGFEGEDRSRFFLWQTSPFYAFPFFRCGLRIPDKFKRDNRMYRLFQMKLAPEAAQVPDANTGIPPSSAIYPYAARLKKYMITSHAVRRRLKPLLLRGEFGAAGHVPQEALDYLRENAQRIAPLMSSDAVLQTLLPHANKTQYANWWTLASLDKIVQRGSHGRSTIGNRRALAS